MSCVELYPFQARGLDEGRARYREGKRAVLFVGPTGMGKTTLASEAATGVISRGGSVLAVAHRRELVKQLAERFELFGLEVGYFGRRLGAPVQVRSVQEILASGELPSCTFAILDEAHHYVSTDWIRVPRALLDAGAKIMGLTATPERDDGRGLGEVFDALVVVAQVRELVELNGREPRMGITPIEVIAPVAHTRKLAQEPVDAYLEHAPGRSAVVFAPNLLNARAFVDNFRAREVAVDLVHGELASDARDGALARFARGDLRVIVNVGVLTEGWDAPICDVCILARKIGSLALLYQCIGRARRPFAPTPSKVALLLDLGGNVELQSQITPWHPDDELEYSLEGIGVSRKGASIVGPRKCRACSRILDDDIAAAAARGEILRACPECKTKLSKIVLFKPEEIELARVVREATEQRRATLSKSTKALATMYVKALRGESTKRQAEAAWLRMFARGKRLHAVPIEVRVPAWQCAIDIVAREKGDTWIPEDGDAAGAA